MIHQTLEKKTSSGSNNNVPSGTNNAVMTSGFLSAAVGGTVNPGISVTSLLCLYLQ